MDGWENENSTGDLGRWIRRRRSREPSANCAWKCRRSRGAGQVTAFWTRESAFLDRHADDPAGSSEADVTGGRLRRGSALDRLDRLRGSAGPPSPCARREKKFRAASRACECQPSISDKSGIPDTCSI